MDSITQLCWHIRIQRFALFENYVNLRYWWPLLVWLCTFTLSLARGTLLGLSSLAFRNLIAVLGGRFPWWCLFLKIISDGAYGIFWYICDFHFLSFLLGISGEISKILGTHTHTLFSLLLGGKCVVVLSMDSWLQMEMKRICEHNTF